MVAAKFRRLISPVIVAGDNFLSGRSLGWQSHHGV